MRNNAPGKAFLGKAGPRAGLFFAGNLLSRARKVAAAPVPGLSRIKNAAARNPAKEIRDLPPRQVLLENEEFVVVMARAEQIPRLLQMIGRYREETFRAVGEGTGKERDLDVFDNFYWHLVLWHKANREPAGAYRMGRVDEILPRFGPQGLYVNTLFALAPGFFNRIGPALELGRAFVYPPYQKRLSPVTLLWKGIGRFLAGNPHYVSLYGPASISADYRERSRFAIAQYLSVRCFSPELARFVTPRTPPVIPPEEMRAIEDSGLSDLDALNEFVRSLEADGKAAPGLLQYYLRMGGRALGVNVDESFSNVLDSLIIVDVPALNPRWLARFMGPERARTYLAYHRAGLRKRA